MKNKKNMVGGGSGQGVVGLGVKVDVNEELMFLWKLKKKDFFLIFFLGGGLGGGGSGKMRTFL